MDSHLSCKFFLGKEIGLVFGSAMINYSNDNRLKKVFSVIHLYKAILNIKTNHSINQKPNSLKALYSDIMYVLIKDVSFIDCTLKLLRIVTRLISLIFSFIPLSELFNKSGHFLSRHGFMSFIFHREGSLLNV